VSAQLPQLAGMLDNPLQDVRMLTPQERKVYIFNMPKSRQTLVGLYRPLQAVTSDRDKALLELWGNYFGGDMSSVLFQQVREFRSLAYSTQGLAITPNLAQSTDPSAFIAFIGTQGDKAMQAIALLDSLVNDMPMSSENLDVARQSLLNGINNFYPSFRGKSRFVAAEERRGYTSDERATLVRLLPSLSQADVEAFYRQHIKGQPYELVIVGDVKKLDLKALAGYGAVELVKKDDIYKTKETKSKKR